MDPLTPPRVALVTCAEFPDLHDDDRPLLAALASRGVRAQAARWDDETVDWGSFTLVVVRNTWDYHRRATEMLAWVDRASRASRLVNPPAILRWNAHKGYLRDLEARGVGIVPTAWCARGEPADLDAVLASRGWTRAVVKPAVSGGAENSMRVDDATRAAARALFARIVAGGDAMVQPYLASVETYGERSLVFLGGAYSHAIRKHALLAPGAVDRRRQDEGIPRVEPTPTELDFARRALDAARAITGEDPLYARVDVAPSDEGAPLLMELELLEPSLFFRDGPGSLERFADLLARRARDRA